MTPLARELERQAKDDDDLVDATLFVDDRNKPYGISDVEYGGDADLLSRENKQSAEEQSTRLRALTSALQRHASTTSMAHGLFDNGLFDSMQSIRDGSHQSQVSRLQVQ
jgi:hypothetical protein